MAIVRPIENQQMWAKWLQERPPIIQQMAADYPPDRLYHYKTTNQRGTIYSYAEDGTVTLNVTGEYCLVEFPRSVFGVDPAKLVECDLPPPEEPVGTLLKTNEQVEQHINTVKRQRGLDKEQKA